jgi:hypothetical protein
MMNQRYYPHIPVGHYGGVAYRLMPNTTLLQPTKPVNWEDDRHVYPPTSLGINLTVDQEVTVDPKETPMKAGPRQRSRKDVRTDESTQSGDSDSKNDKTGFVFYQLGNLEYTAGLNDPTTTDVNLLPHNLGITVALPWWPSSGLRTERKKST